VHHILRTVAENTMRHGCQPDGQQIGRMLDENFFLPAASKTAHHQLKEAARQLVYSYVNEYDDDLRWVWEIERPFETRPPVPTLRRPQPVPGRSAIISPDQGPVRFDRSY
jgi:hypothetical protein